MASEIKYQNPFIGPLPFKKSEKALFFGRERETRELLSHVIAHREILLYGMSGTGKSSLMNAGLIPLLEEEGFEVLPIARGRGRIPKDIKLETIANIFVFNALLSWTDEKATDPVKLAKTSLGVFLKERKHITGKDGFLSPRVVIFDQFEELFTAYRERWEDRKDFFVQVADALEGDPLLRVIFLLREDYLAQLAPYVHLLPKKLRTRFRLEGLREGAARLAVKGPLQKTKRQIDEHALEKLLDDLLKVLIETPEGKTREVKGEFVEPVQLQVVCHRLWQDLPPGNTTITRTHLKAFGDVDQALLDFYENSLKETSWQTGVMEDDLRRWFQNSLITPAGTRGTVYKGPEATGDIPNKAVRVLEDLHVIRGEQRGGSRWLELTHDRLIRPILKSNRQHLGIWQGLTLFQIIVKILNQLKTKPAVILWSTILLLYLWGLKGDAELIFPLKWRHALLPDLAWRDQLVTFVTGIIILVVIPCLIIKFVFKERLIDYGLGWPKDKRKSGLKALAVLMVIYLPPFYLATADPGMQAEYPLFGDSITTLAGFIFYQLSYFLFFVATEFIFRGYLLFGLFGIGKDIETIDDAKNINKNIKDSEALGLYAILIQMLIAFNWHMVKPVPEFLGVLFWSLGAAAVALKVRSIWPIVIPHWLLNVFFDTVLWLKA